MSIKTFAAGAAVALATFCTTSVAMADETGFASSHDWRKERGMNCFVDHFHYGSSTTQPTRAKAERDAINSWSSFTDFEYGSNWARYGKAGSKKMTCKQGGGGWECNVEARPCR